MFKLKQLGTLHPADGKELTTLINY